MRRISCFLLVNVTLTICMAQPRTVWEVPPEARKLKNKSSLTGEKMDSAVSLFNENCLICHGEKGASNGPEASSLSPPPASFTNAKMMAKAKDGELFWKISKGRAPMPGYESQLSEADRWQLVNYVRHLTARSQYRYLGSSRTPRR